MNFGEIVIYTEHGVEYNATVIGSRFLDHHAGANEEPLLHLAFFKAVTKPGPKGKAVAEELSGTNRQMELVQFRHDVVHETHEFSDKTSQKLFGKSNVTHPGGRWKEAEVTTFTGTQLEDEDNPKPKKKKKVIDAVV